MRPLYVPMHTDKTPIELLAPAGSPETGYAAFQYGADAIYLGLRRFSARATASNFSPDELASITGFGHRQERPRKVYVAINTLVQEAELPRLITQLEVAADAGVDALIVQDLGVCRVVREHFPELALHASTQMAIHSRAAAEQVKELGISRVIPARELTTDEIAEIAGVIETEIFVHGSLCYGYSGLCLLSSHLYGLSGNRGKCAYVCRESFGSPDALLTPTLSMKDLALDGDLDVIRRAGVASLKIEGRKKSPLYVAATTSYYRRLLDGPISAEEHTALKSDLQTIFNRPETTLYFQSTRNPDDVETPVKTHMGAPLGRISRVVRGQPDAIRFIVEHRRLERHDGIQILTDEGSFGFSAMALRECNGKRSRNVHGADPGIEVEVELPARHPLIHDGDPVYCASSTAVTRQFKIETPRTEQYLARHPVRLRIKFEEKQIEVNATLQQTDGNVRYCLKLDEALSPARNLDGVSRAVDKAFSRLGASSVQIEELQVENPNGLFAPASLLNQVRRDAVAAIEKEIDDRRHLRIQTVIEAVKRKIEPMPEAPRFDIYTDQPASLPEQLPDEIDEIVVLIGSPGCRDLVNRFAGRLRIALPTIVRATDEDALRREIDWFLTQGVRNWQIAGLAGRQYLAAWNNLNVSADWPLYALNTAAIASLQALGFKRITTSPEDDGRNVIDLGKRFGPQLQVPLYQDTPLAVSEACIHRDRACDRHGCDRGAVSLTGKSAHQLMAVTQDCRTTIISDMPYSITHRLAELQEAGFRRFRIDCLTRRYSSEEMAAIIDAACRGEAVPDTHEGNFARSLE